MSELFERAESFITGSTGRAADTPDVLENAQFRAQTAFNNLFQKKLHNYFKLPQGGVWGDGNFMQMGYFVMRGNELSPSTHWIRIKSMFAGDNIQLRARWFCDISNDSNAQNDVVFWETPQSAYDFSSAEFIAACEEIILRYTSEKYGF